MRKKGITLVEVLITIVIVAGLAAMAIPNFAKTMEKAAANQAIAYLRTIATAEKLYYAKNKTYFGGAGANAAAINAALGAEVSERNYTFSLTSTPTTFTARADKNSGSGAISINETGSIQSPEALPPYVIVPAD